MSHAVTHDLPFASMLANQQWQHDSSLMLWHLCKNKCNKLWFMVTVNPRPGLHFSAFHDVHADRQICIQTLHNLQAALQAITNVCYS